MKKIGLVLILWATTLPLWAGVLELRFSPENAAFDINTGGVFDGMTSFGLSGFYNVKGDYATNLYFGTSLIENEQSPFLFSINVSSHFLKINDLSEMPLFIGLGAQVGYRFLTPIPTAIFANLDYSPNILSLDPSKHYINTRISYEALLTPVAIVFLGHEFRYMRFNEQKVINGKSERGHMLANHFMMGLKIRF